MLDGGGVAEQSPDPVTREISARLAGMDAAARGLARAAAVLGGGASLRQGAGLAGIDAGAAADAADALIAAGVLRSVQPLEFLHPLIGAAVYAGLGAGARAHEHARAARLLAEEGESPERVAAQLLRCPPTGDTWVFERLLAAARLAAARGAGDAVATYLSRALDEPAPLERRPEILFELGAAESHFDPGAAVEHLREALAGELEVSRRFQATMLLSGVLAHVGRVGEAADVIEEQFDALTARPELRGPTEAALANITRIDPATRRRADAVIERMRRRVEDGDRDPPVLGTIAAEMGMAGEPADRMNELAEIALLGMQPTAATATGWSWYNAVRSLISGERYDVALGALNTELERARERGTPIDIGGVLVFRSELYWHVGDLANAEVDARTLLEIADGYGWILGMGTANWVLGAVLTERGELEEAESVSPVRWAPRPARVLLRVGATRPRAAAPSAGTLGRRRRGAARVRPPRRRDRPDQPRDPALALRSSRTCSSHSATRPTRAGWRSTSSAARTPSAAGGRSASHCAPPRGSRPARRRSGCCARPARSSTSPPRNSSAPAATSTSARRCDGVRMRRAPGSGCAWRSTSPTAAGLGPWRTWLWGSCVRRARGRAAGCRRVPVL